MEIADERVQSASATDADLVPVSPTLRYERRSCLVLDELLRSLPEGFREPNGVMLALALVISAFVTAGILVKVFGGR